MERMVLRTIKPEFRDSFRPARAWSSVRGSSEKGMSAYRSAVDSKRWNLHFVQNGASNEIFMISRRWSAGDSESHGLHEEGEGVLEVTLPSVSPYIDGEPWCRRREHNHYGRQHGDCRSLSSWIGDEYYHESGKDKDQHFPGVTRPLPNTS
jgi:hypothetical protein